MFAASTEFNRPTSFTSFRLMFDRDCDPFGSTNKLLPLLRMITNHHRKILTNFTNLLTMNGFNNLRITELLIWVWSWLSIRPGSLQSDIWLTSSYQIWINLVSFDRGDTEVFHDMIYFKEIIFQLVIFIIQSRVSVSSKITISKFDYNSENL